MFRNFYKLFTPEAFSLLRPKGLINQIIKFIRLFLGTVQLHTSRTVSCRDSVIKRRYTLVTIKAKDIINVHNTNIADDGMLAGISTSPKHGFNFQCKVDGKWLMLGCGYTTKIAVIGVDYIIDNNNVYWFKDNPSSFCYTFEDNGEIIYLTVGFGGDHKQLTRQYSPESSVFNNPSVAILYDIMLRNGFRGLDNSRYLALQGIVATKGLTGSVKYKWTQDSTEHAITTTGSMISAPSGSLNLKLFSPVSCVNSQPKTFVVELSENYYPVLTSNNSVSNYPGILDKYPSLTVVNGVFQGSELLEIMKTEGYQYLEITERHKSVTLRDCAFLSNITLYLGTVTVPVPLSCASYVAVNPTREVTFQDTLFKNISINFKYI